MSRSSIFSSDSLDLRGLRPRGLFAAAVLLLAFDALVSRQDWIWAREPRSDAGIVDVMEAMAIRAGVEPRIVFLGSSRLRDAIAPRELEGQLGLAPGSVLNLGLTAGTPFDSLVLYRRNRDVLGRADLVVVGVEDWYVNVRIKPGERDRRFASFGERLHDYRWPYSADLLCGWAFRTYDARDALRRWLTGAGSRAAPPITADGRVSWRDLEMETGPETVDVTPSVALYFRRCEIGDLRFEQLRTLLDEIARDGPNVAILQVPWRDAYLTEREHMAAPAASAYEARLAALRESRPAVAFLLYGRGGDVGLGGTRFYDYGHLTTAGAREFTRLIAPHLRAFLSRANGS